MLESGHLQLRVWGDRHEEVEVHGAANRLRALDRGRSGIRLGFSTSARRGTGWATGDREERQCRDRGYDGPGIQPGVDHDVARRPAGRRDAELLPDDFEATDGGLQPSTILTADLLASDILYPCGIVQVI